MIKELTILSPAEVLLIEDPAVTVGTLARVTFFDLLLREVLQIEDNAKSTTKEEKNQWYVLEKHTLTTNL